MSELKSKVPVLHNNQELEEAIKKYKSSDLSVNELLCQWQAIRDAALNLGLSNKDTDKVPGQDSY
ncbi:hypothetical protein ACE1B6_04430 [Aerosakkonemataceae cyanobacterium BLCC-F154]|uniref:Uncharacterized protein n=1 Tax=Floridaenema fluviatile BLCC-F154 TaxID=3153640 RepID=A0ABV4Y724_9CYAN